MARVIIADGSGLIAALGTMLFLLLLAAGLAAYRARTRATVAEANLLSLRKVKESEERFHALANCMPVIVWTSEPDGYLDYYNDRWYDYTGSPRGDGGDQSWEPILHPDDLQLCLNTWYAAVRDGAPYQIEYRFKQHSTGAYRWHLGRATPIRDENGIVIKWYGTCTDIHDMKHAQEALKAREAQLNTIIETVPVGLVLAELPSGKIMGGNKYVEEMLRHPVLYSPDVDSYDEWVSYHADGTRVNGHEYPLARMMRDGEETPSIDVHYQRGDGTRAWTRILGRPVKDHLGKITGGVVALIDIDEQEKSRAALEKALEYRLAERVASVGHWRMALPALTLEWSEELYRIVGLDPAQGVPTAEEIIQLYHPEDRDKARNALIHTLKTGAGWDFTIRLIGPDGLTRWVKSHGVAEQGESGQICAVFGVLADVTELEKARRTAEEAAVVKASFLANMSHEIRTPLNAIIGFTDLILDDDGLSETHHRQLRLVKNSGDALLTVVNDILDFSKMEAGEIELTTRPFDLAHLAHSASSIIRQSAEAKGLVLTIQASPELNQYYVGDDNRIRQVLLNLLSNAVKFTKEGNVALTIACVSHEPEDLVTFTVTDTGAGVPVDEEHRLFQQFSQANSSISREHGGTGLGLAISKKLVISMGGEIGFRRGPLGGSEFWCSIPLTRSAATEVARKSPEATTTRAQRILVVEDVAANQELVTAMLSRGGHEVSIASNGREALAVVQRQDFDLILMDVQMPIMDGVTATKLIRLLPGNVRAVPIIALTANILPQQISAFHSAGMNDHVGKPINLIELNEAIARNTLHKGSAIEAGPAREEPIDSWFDEKIYRDMADLLPAERLRVHSATLKLAMSQLEKFEGTCDAIRSVAHKMVSQAGMFGFVRLSALCSDLENCPAERSAPDHIAFAIRSAIAHASERLDQLQTDNSVRRSA